MMAFLLSRIGRGYLALLVGVLIFFARPLVAPDQLDGAVPFLGATVTRVLYCMNGGGFPACVEPVILAITAVLMALVIGWGGLRSTLLAGIFVIPPLLIYATLYPIWIVFMMLLIVPPLAHAALNSWMPEA